MELDQHGAVKARIRKNRFEKCWEGKRHESCSTRTLQKKKKAEEKTHLGMQTSNGRKKEELWRRGEIHGLSWSMWATLTKKRQTRRLKQLYFSQFWRLESSRSRCGQIWFLVRTHFLARRKPSCCVSTGPREIVSVPLTPP